MHRVVALGGTKVANGEQYGVRWVELHDPENNAFYITSPRPEGDA